MSDDTSESDRLGVKTMRWKLAKLWYDRFGWCVHYPGFGWLAPLGERVRLRYYPPRKEEVPMIYPDGSRSGPPIPEGGGPGAI